MENAGRSVKAPGAAIAAFILGIGSMLMPLLTGLLLYLLYVTGLTVESGMLREALSRGFSLLIKGIPVLALAAIVCGGIGLHQSRRLPRTSKEGVAFSLIGLAAGVLTVVIIVVMLSSMKI